MADDMIPLPPPGRGGRHNHGQGRHGGRGGWQRGHGRGRGQGGRGRGQGGRGRGQGGRGNGRGRGRGRGNGGRGGYDSAINDPIEEMGEPSSNSVSIAIEGCCHGELDMVYERIQQHEKKTGQKIDLLLCCGDFQSHRNAGDFHSSSIPPKYRSLGTFPSYYAGEKKAPILTLFIGGNHEASQPLRELYYGGWVAPNIYYMGAAGVVRYGGLRIGGMSGIYKSHDYRMGHFERPPFDRSTLRSVYHVRNVDVYRMKCLSKGSDRLDLMLSHDWPLGIEQHGNTQELLRRKPFFRAEVEQNCLGSPPSREVMDTVRPRWWFSAHLHVKFKATLRHHSEEQSTALEDPGISLVPSQVLENSTATKPDNGSESNDDNRGIDKADEIESGVRTISQDAQPKTDPSEDHETNFHAVESSNRCAGPDLTDQMTQFLALDKCLPRRQYLSILHVPTSCPKEDARLEYDADWLAIIRKTHHLTCTERQRVDVPNDLVEVSESDVEWVVDRLKGRQESGDLAVPENFSRTVPIYSDPLFMRNCPPFPAMGNPQMDNLLEILELEHLLTVPYDPQMAPEIISERQTVTFETEADENEIDIDEMSEGEGGERVENSTNPRESDKSAGDASQRDPDTRIDNDDENEMDLDSLDEGSPTETQIEVSADPSVSSYKTDEERRTAKRRLKRQREKEVKQRKKHLKAAGVDITSSASTTKIDAADEDEFTYTPQAEQETPQQQKEEEPKQQEQKDPPVIEEIPNDGSFLERMKQKTMDKFS